MSREQYLQKFWMPYPPMPTGAKAYGRLHSLNAKTGSAQLIRDGRIFENQLISLQSAPPEWDLMQVRNCLRAGDLLALSEHGEATLLAPAMVEKTPLTADPQVLRRWSQFQNEVRGFFTSSGFSEIFTPGLVMCPGTEPSLDVFQTEFVVGSKKKSLFLPTSPELHLKKALVAGWDRIFEIKTCYRNGEITDRHQPEFTLLEWYRAWEGPKAIREDAVNLVSHLTKKFADQGAKAPEKIKHTTMAELFHQVLDEKITPESNLADYQAMAQRQGLTVGPQHTIDDLFFLLFTEKIESAFHPDEMVLVGDWPPFQAALARLTSEGWADRFEIYWQGFELANAFHELNDPDVQQKRFEEDLQKKSGMGKTPVPLDPDFMQSLKAGMPPSAGIALGLERLFMATFGIKTIQELKLFPWKN